MSMHHHCIIADQSAFRFFIIINEIEKVKLLLTTLQLTQFLRLNIVKRGGGITISFITTIKSWWLLLNINIVIL